MQARAGRWALFIASWMVSMTATAATVTGSATYRERIALPPDAAFEATVEDVSRADAPSIVIGRVSFMPAGQVPIRFEIPVRDDQVDAGHRYTVRARITVGTRLLYTTTELHPVLTQGAGTTADMLMLRRVAPPAAGSARSLAETYWKLATLNDAAIKPLPKQREPHLELHAQDRRMSGSGGCNRMSGGYEQDGDSIRFDKVATTMMACVEGMEQESAFFKALGEVRRWKISGDRLTLLDGDGKAVAGFVAVDLR